MHWLDRLANALHETIVVDIRAIDLGKRSGRQHDVRKGGRVRFEQFLNGKEIKPAECVNALRWQQATRDIRPANRSAGVFEQFIQILRVGIDVVGADTVVEERQRMKQNSPALAGKQIRKLRHDSLRRSAQLSAEHYDQVALGFVNRLTQSCDLVSINAQLPRGQLIIIGFNQREDGRVFASRFDMQELRRLFAQTNRHAVDDD